MTESSESRQLGALVHFLDTLMEDEDIVTQIRRGQTRYGRQTFVYFLVNIGKLPSKTGNSPIELRQLVISMNVDDRKAEVVDCENWIPYASVYDH